jgi:hypothetical protein
MSGELYVAVVVRRRDVVIAHHQARVRHGAILGEGEGSALPFPGGPLRVQRLSDGWWIGARRVAPGEPERWAFEDVEVEIEVAPPPAGPIDLLFAALRGVPEHVARAELALGVAALLVALGVAQGFAAMEVWAAWSAR